MTDDMIKRVATAIVLHFNGGEKLNPNSLTQASILFELAARAALRAMREPTPTMIRCGAGWGMGLGEKEVVDGWQAMIDAALAEKP